MEFYGIHILYWGLLTSFAIISCILAGFTMMNVVRLRNIRMSWKAGNLKGYPLFSTIFLGFATVGIAVSFYDQSFSQFVISVMYMIVALGWFISSYLSSKRFVTDHGIVKNVNEPSQTVAWYQIRDFVEKEMGKDSVFVFIYSQDFEEHSDDLVRLELVVPSSRIPDFKKLISHKLGRRINCYDEEVVKVEQFK